MCRAELATNAPVQALSAGPLQRKTQKKVAKESANRKGLSKRVNPPFTLKTIRDSIPKHCFERSALKGFAHIAVDVFELALWTYALFALEPHVTFSPLLHWALWGAYWFYTGTTLFGLWIIGHECGHHAFSEHDWLSDAVGFVLYTALYTPFYSWQASHNKHHQFTSHIEHDDPWAARVWDGEKRTVRSTLSTAVKAFVILTVGIPCYLLFDLGGVGWTKGEMHSYFSTTAPFLRQKDALKIYVTNMALLAWTYVLYQLSQAYSVLPTLYVPSLVVCYAYLAAITLLHHTHPDVPRLGDGDWTWLKGAMCTIDRTLGTFFDYKVHKIVNTHVCHHIFPKLPFYHAEEATAHIKAILGPEFYNEDKGNFLVAFWQTLEKCNYVDGDGVFHWLSDDHQH